MTNLLCYDSLTFTMFKLILFTVLFLGCLADPLRHQFHSSLNLQPIQHTSNQAEFGTVSSSAAGVSLSLLLEESGATLTFSGPSGVWFGVGFDAPNAAMADHPYAIVIDGSGDVFEFKLDEPEAGHGPGSQLEGSVEVVSSLEENGIRTVVLKRSLTGLTDNYYSFDESVSSIPLIIASGDSAEYGYHGAYTKSGETLNMGPAKSMVKTIEGTVSSEAASTSVTLLLDEIESMATITISGPSGLWFGVGFDAPNFAMADHPYSIVVNGEGLVTERKLDAAGNGHGPGSQLDLSLEIISTLNENGFTTVVVRRSLSGASNDHYTFDLAKTSLPLIIASGDSSEYAYHGTTKSGETLNLAYKNIRSSVSGTFTSVEAATTLKLDLDETTSEAIITLTGPTGVWFSVGFDAPNLLMADKPYAIVVDGNGNVSERKLGLHSPGSLLEPSVEVVSSSSDGGFNTIALRRALVGTSSDHYTFDATKLSLPLIFARGKGATFSRHSNSERGGGIMSLV